MADAAAVLKDDRMSQPVQPVPISHLPAARDSIVRTARGAGAEIDREHCKGRRSEADCIPEHFQRIFYYNSLMWMKGLLPAAPLQT